MPLTMTEGQQLRRCQMTKDEFVETMVKTNRKSVNRAGKKLDKTEAYFMRTWLRHDFEVFKTLGIKLVWDKPSQRQLSKRINQLDCKNL
ncbi:Uncharacterised protein [uncultured archaeon]|nr:Uncharacterised protein [uncultured archaeon]